MARVFYKEDGEVIPAIKYETSAPAGYTLVTDAEELKRLYIKKYLEREQNGKDWFEEFRADLMIKIIDTTYTEVEVFLLEQHLKELSSEIVAGSWLTAQNTSAGLALSGIYDQTMKDDIQAYIDAYVTANY